jgi:hypothetical protein
VPSPALRRFVAPSLSVRTHPSPPGPHSVPTCLPLHVPNVPECPNLQNSFRADVPGRTTAHHPSRPRQNEPTNPGVLGVLAVRLPIPRSKAAKQSQVPFCPTRQNPPQPAQTRHRARPWQNEPTPSSCFMPSRFTPPVPTRQPVPNASKLFQRAPHNPIRQNEPSCHNGSPVCLLPTAYCLLATLPCLPIPPSLR